MVPGNILQQRSYYLASRWELSSMVCEQHHDNVSREPVAFTELATILELVSDAPAARWSYCSTICTDTLLLLVLAPGARRLVRLLLLGSLPHARVLRRHLNGPPLRSDA